MSDCESVDSSEIPFSADNEPMVIDFSKPIVKRKRPTPPPKQPDPEPGYWSGYLQEGAKRFNYMIAHFEEMFESETTIKDFYVNPLTALLFSYEDEHNIVHVKEIQRQLILWIRNELSENRLFDANYWKPFQDWISRNEIYMGYRKMFVFNNTYFQLVMGATDEIIAKFELIHYDEVSCLPDNMMADNYWKRKY
jgi:hypothetical protein